MLNGSLKHTLCVDEGKKKYNTKKRENLSSKLDADGQQCQIHLRKQSPVKTKPVQCTYNHRLRKRREGAKREGVRRKTKFRKALT